MNIALRSLKIESFMGSLSSWLPRLAYIQLKRKVERCFWMVFCVNCIRFALNEGSSIQSEKLNSQTERIHVFAYILLFCAMVKVLGATRSPYILLSEDS